MVTAGPEDFPMRRFALPLLALAALAPVAAAVGDVHQWPHPDVLLPFYVCDDVGCYVHVCTHEACFYLYHATGACLDAGDLPRSVTVGLGDPGTHGGCAYASVYVTLPGGDGFAPPSPTLP